MSSISNPGLFTSNYYKCSAAVIGGKSFWLCNDTVTVWDIGTTTFTSTKLNPNGHFSSITPINSSDLFTINTRPSGGNFKWYLVKLHYDGGTFTQTELFDLNITTKNDFDAYGGKSSATYSASLNSYFFVLDHTSYPDLNGEKKTTVITLNLGSNSLSSQKYEFGIDGLEAIK